MKINFHKHILDFIIPAGTSRSILHSNTIWIIRIEENGRVGYGECNPLKGLSLDYGDDFESILKKFIDDFEKQGYVKMEALGDFPAMKFAFESALLDLNTEERMILYPSEFTRGERSIAINGLLWMGTKDYMLEQLEKKIKEGFSCIKMKIGAINFQHEIDVLTEIRGNFSAADIEIRVDANGAFTTKEALDKLKILSSFDIHSIEQPIAVGHWKEMKYLCKNAPIPIALDEELIPLRNKKERLDMITLVNPDYIILKPSLLGGFEDCDEWIDIAERSGVKWWITSALESNVGLNAIAQYSYAKGVSMPQGLGTGGLYSNNYPSPLYISNGNLFYNPKKTWENL